jgi:ATP-dependent DNA helicase RecG
MNTKIKKILEKGEGISIEFKECSDVLPKSIYETVCAFLNRNGGEILLGVKDNKEIQGINKNKIEQIKKDFITTINNSQKMSPPVYLSINQVEINKKQILHIYVPVGSQVQKCKNRIFDRNEDGDIDITDNQTLVAQLYLKKQTSYSENKVYPYCKLNDLDENIINKARKLAVNQNNTHPWKEMSNLELLKSAKLYSKDYQTNEEGITLAGILLFGKEETILSVLPHHKTDLILRKINLDRYDDRDDVRINLIDSYERIIAFGEKHLPNPFYLEGTQRVNIRNKILREITSNILMHREFTNPFPAKFIIEKNQIKTENANKPNGHGKINLDNFSPYPKNPIIARVFKEIGFADELGSGMRNLTKYVHIYSNAKPELIENDIFTIIIPLQDTPQDTPQDTQQDKILKFCQIEKTREEIQNYISIKDREYFRKSILNPLIEQKLIELTIPDKPTSKNQKYKITKKGLNNLK